jgi:hypothetical protein
VSRTLRGEFEFLHIKEPECIYEFFVRVIVVLWRYNNFKDHCKLYGDVIVNKKNEMKDINEKVFQMQLNEKEEIRGNEISQ